MTDAPTFTKLIDAIDRNDNDAAKIIAAGLADEILSIGDRIAKALEDIACVQMEQQQDRRADRG